MCSFISFDHCEAGITVPISQTRKLRTRVAERCPRVTLLGMEPGFHWGWGRGSEASLVFTSLGCLCCLPPSLLTRSDSFSIPPSTTPWSFNRHGKATAPLLCSLSSSLLGRIRLCPPCRVSQLCSEVPVASLALPFRHLSRQARPRKSRACQLSRWHGIRVLCGRHLGMSSHFSVPRSFLYEVDPQRDHGNK